MPRSEPWPPATHARSSHPLPAQRRSSSTRFTSRTTGCRAARPSLRWRGSSRSSGYRRRWARRCGCATRPKSCHSLSMRRTRSRSRCRRARAASAVSAGQGQGRPGWQGHGQGRDKGRSGRCRWVWKGGGLAAEVIKTAAKSAVGSRRRRRGAADERHAAALRAGHRCALDTAARWTSTISGIGQSTM